MKNIRQIFIILFIILLGLGISAYLLNSEPVPKRDLKKKKYPLVNIIDTHVRDIPTTVEAMGKVIPARSIILSPRVSGELIKVSKKLRPGAHFLKGEFIAKIDPSDFKLALRQTQAKLVKAKFDLELEKGKGIVAQREYELLGESINEADKPMVLRKPHLRSAKANVDSAKAIVEQAKLNLQRSKIVSPFNAIIKDPNIGLGLQVNANTNMATLVDANAYWIEASVSVNNLSLISINDFGPSVYIEPRNSQQIFAKGHVKTIKSNVENKGHMARVIIEVKDPTHSIKGAPMLLDDLLKVHISTNILKDLIPISRAYVHNGNKIYLLNKNMTLHICNISVVYADAKNIYIPQYSILKTQKLITSQLPNSIEGMHLRIKKN